MVNARVDIPFRGSGLSPIGSIDVAGPVRVRTGLAPQEPEAIQPKEDGVCRGILFQCSANFEALSSAA